MFRNFSCAVASAILLLLIVFTAVGLWYAVVWAVKFAYFNAPLGSLFVIGVMFGAISVLIVRAITPQN